MAYYGDDNAFEDRERLKEEGKTRFHEQASEEGTKNNKIASLLSDKKRVENELLQTPHPARREQLRLALQHIQAKLAAAERGEE